jgi:2-keto-3-deoxy-L-rhamnonate aldolase RhmA
MQEDYMRKNKVKELLRTGDVAFGTNIFEFGTTGIARIVAEAGADFIFLDMEHTGWSIETIRTMIASTGGLDLVPVVRPPALQYHLLSAPLDMGAMGLMVPMVETEDQARMIVQFAKYYPAGQRGAAFGFAHDDYKGGDVFEKMKSANEEVLLAAFVETARGIENVDRIAAVEGIDVLQVGQFDLTNSLGIPGQFEHPTYKRSLDRVLEACMRNGKAAGFMATSVEEGQRLLEQGFRCIEYWGDIFIYRQALGQAITALRDSTSAARGSSQSRK